ncbi:MAG: carboxynorspermidine decarboxylase [Defluviitaleaceae bacterium]|nr:carboxynorspermidine decarboxylase [Defluviitaleaceae bacterium]
MVNFDIYALPSPCYIVDEALVIRNLDILTMVKEATGCKILLAQKAFSMFSMYPLISQYLDGTCASGLYEAKLADEYFRGENHVFSPAYYDHEFDEIVRIADHIVFNSFAQWGKFRGRVGDCVCGMRINPEVSTQTTAIYDPCAPLSRLGVTIDNFLPNQLEGLTGLHFHTLCQQNFDALEITLAGVEEKFGKYLHHMEWLNFGGGHHITRPDYEIDRLIFAINTIKRKYNFQVYLEPGEAVVLNTGFLVAEVCDIIDNAGNIAILDTSAACHMPDVLEMPYRPEIIGADMPGVLGYTYRLGGPTCLAGDIIGDYSFAEPLQIGQRLVFCDMALYSMVKNNTFNGMRLPSIAIYDKNCKINIVKEFGYEDFRGRLS